MLRRVVSVCPSPVSLLVVAVPVPFCPSHGLYPMVLNLPDILDQTRKDEKQVIIPVLVILGLYLILPCFRFNLTDYCTFLILTVSRGSAQPPGYTGGNLSLLSGN